MVKEHLAARRKALSKAPPSYVKRGSGLDKRQLDGTQQWLRQHSPTPLPTKAYRLGVYGFTALFFLFALGMNPPTQVSSLALGVALSKIFCSWTRRDRPDEFAWIQLKSMCDVSKFNDIKASLANLEARDELLMSAQSIGQLTLAQT